MRLANDIYSLTKMNTKCLFSVIEKLSCFLTFSIKIEIISFTSLVDKVLSLVDEVSLTSYFAISAF